METIKIQYTGSLRTEAVHLKSQQKIITDAPLDNNGKGEAFSPSDLMSASLGSCMLTIMGMVCERNDINIEGTGLRITKIMAAAPRRVAEIILEFDMPDVNYSVKEKKLLEEAARTCPVSKSLHPDLKQTVIFNYR